MGKTVEDPMETVQSGAQPQRADVCGRPAHLAPAVEVALLLRQIAWVRRRLIIAFNLTSPAEWCHWVFSSLSHALDPDHPKIRKIGGYEMIGPGGGPVRATTLPKEAAERKRYPVGTGVLDYFPDAIVAISNVSWHGNEQHNPGQSLRWSRSKSSDEADTLIRHFLQRGQLDTDGTRHSAKMAWRALALLQKEIEDERAPLPLADGRAELDGRCGDPGHVICGKAAASD